MGRRLRREEVVTIQVLAEKGEAKRQIARTLGVSEGTVRYHLRRAEAGAEDGRKEKAFRVQGLADVIDAWWRERTEEQKNGARGAAGGASARPPNVRELYELLAEQYRYEGSYKSVLRYVRARFPRPRIRTYRRVETPAGAQSQTDWGEFPRVDVGDGPEPLHAFVMSLSHSRMPAVVWSRREDQLAWLHCHNEAYRRLQGVAAVNRIDNLKTGISRGAGPWGTINEVYRAYAVSVGFHIDACPPRAGNAKGKVEAKVRLARLKLNPYRRRFDGLEDLQAMTDARLRSWAGDAVCPATGKSVLASWDDELLFLAPVPRLPEPFDIAVTRPVYKDCTVRFEGRSYAVPFARADDSVEIRGCAGRVQILAHGKVAVEYPRGTAERILLDPRCYEGEATDRVLPPPPLGRMGVKLQEILETPVAHRPIDLYAALAEVAR
ncbi:MAG: IS21 family transposase [Planctomycetota bacterium]|jgi:transposase